MAGDRLCLSWRQVYLERVGGERAAIDHVNVTTVTLQRRGRRQHDTSGQPTRKHDDKQMKIKLADRLLKSINKEKLPGYMSYSCSNRSSCNNS